MSILSILRNDLHILAAPLVKYRAANIPPWKWAREDKFGYFVVVPAFLGGGFGGVLGIYEGFRISYTDTVPYKILCTGGGFFSGSVVGAMVAGLWPVAVPFSIARAYFPRDAQSVSSWNIFKPKNTQKTT